MMERKIISVLYKGKDITQIKTEFDITDYLLSFTFESADRFYGRSDTSCTLKYSSKAEYIVDAMDIEIKYI